MSLKSIFTPNGLQVGAAVNIEKDDILNEEPFDGDCDSEEEDYTGNESMTAAYRYHKTVSQILPCRKPWVQTDHAGCTSCSEGPFQTSRGYE